MKKFIIQTLGCKINQCESGSIEDLLSSHGFIATTSLLEADIIIINTCTVTNRTDYKSRNLIKKAAEIKKHNNGVVVIVTGCYSQRHRDEILRTGFVDYIVDNNQKDKILEIVQQNKTLDFNEIDKFNKFCDISNYRLTKRKINNRSKAFIKIQDGCDCFCTYCAVPFARGKPRSRSLTSILEELDSIVELGYQELVISGVNLGLYNSDGLNLASLLSIISKYESLQKIRLSSIEPQLFTDELFEVISKIEKIEPHFHIPLQSGCDELLKIHNRKYLTDDIVKLVNKLREIKVEPVIGFDVIVGLPFETDEYFDETYNFLQSIGYSYLHVFLYSKRKGTVAALMDNQIHGSIAKKRSKQLLGTL